MNGPRNKRKLSQLIDDFHADNQGCVNGDWIADDTEDPDFIDLLLDERYDMDDPF